MPRFTSPALSLAAAALIALPAYAATPNVPSRDASSNTADSADANTMAQTTADRDFGKVSRDGATAFADIDSARLAIFNGQTGKAEQDVQQAEAMLTKAKSDDTVFTKAEADLKVPAGTTQRGPANATPSTTQVAWLPIGGMMAIDEDYTASKAKNAGVTKADEQVKQGNTKQAMETLKLHDVDVSFIEQVAPLDATLKGVQEAASDLSQGHYFAANQALKKIDDGVRVDDVSYTGTPNGKTAANDK
jgi:hypothetical protein